MLLSGVVPPFVFTEVNIPVICISCRATQFQYFDVETFAFFQDVLLEIYPSLEFHSDLSTAKYSEVLENFEKFVLIISNKSRIFHSVICSVNSILIIVCEM